MTRDLPSVMQGCKSIAVTTPQEGTSMKKYRVQAILIETTAREGVRETITNSITCEDWEAGMDYLMKKHKASASFLYIAMDLETQEILAKTRENKYR